VCAQWNLHSPLNNIRLYGSLDYHVTTIQKNGDRGSNISFIYFDCSNLANIPLLPSDEITKHLLKVGITFFLLTVLLSVISKARYRWWSCFSLRCFTRVSTTSSTARLLPFFLKVQKNRDWVQLPLKLMNS
jgi:hypothetical protein